MTEEEFEKLHARVRALEIMAVTNVMIDGMNRGVENIAELGKGRKEVLYGLAEESDTDDQIADALRRLGDLTVSLTGLVPSNWKDPKPNEVQE